MEVKDRRDNAQNRNTNLPESGNNVQSSKRKADDCSSHAYSGSAAADESKALFSGLRLCLFIRLLSLLSKRCSLLPLFTLFTI